VRRTRLPTAPSDLRRCSEELKDQPTSIVRELHVYGTAVPVHSRDPKKFQHQVFLVVSAPALLIACVWQGFGTLLMEEAERIARDEHGSVKLAVISGEHRCFVSSSLILSFCRRWDAQLLSQIGLLVGRAVYEQVAVLGATRGRTCESIDSPILCGRFALGSSPAASVTFSNTSDP
jgi:hypothetical protein